MIRNKCDFLTVHKHFLLYKYKNNCPVNLAALFFQRAGTIFKLNSHRTNYVTSRNTAPPPGRHVYSPIWTIFELVRDINKTNVLTKFHDDWANHLTSKVFTRFF
ncbi:hypothetical protein DPMN_183281 [Dreissena polymorpha]|uniref:Uncharacterized protein n=1 Tax=Dreissena polymorpha TaxID=45954 RepID=A0A9D4I3G8_DREPO|nr:hypothetical protein DPMN_183281 [Dreissena polymorpha]